MTTATSAPSIWRRLRYTRLRDVLRGRLDARLDWQQTVALADLPASLSDATCHVVRRTRLWRNEKVDVANDLIAHFQDGLAFGHSPDELLKSFGDPQAAAQLIRRAKRRNRPLLWHAGRFGVMAVAALVGAYIAMGLWMSFDRPMIRTDYLAMVNKAPAAVPVNERAWPVYREALAALGFNKLDENSSAKAFLESEAKTGQEGWPAREKFVTNHSEAIAKLREAASRKDLGFVASTSQAGFSEADREFFGFKVSPGEIETAKHATNQDHWIIATHLPHMLQLREAARTLAADAERAAAAGDGATAYANVVAMLGISRHAEETPFLICLLVAESIQQKARGVVRAVLADHPSVWSDEQLRDLAHLFAAARISWQRGFDGQTMSFHDSMQRLYTDNGTGDGRLAFRVNEQANVFQVIDMAIIGDAYQNSRFSNNGLAILAMPAANMVVASRKDMIDMYEKLTNYVRAQIEAPLWKQGKDESLDSGLSALRAEPLGKYRYLFVDLLMPAYDALRHRIIISDGDRDGVFIGLALELHHRKHKEWPRSLAELSPQYLPQVPVDPITGKALHFKIVDDRPVVYSMGADADDDGGRPTTDEVVLAIPKGSTPQDGDWVLWSTAKSH